MTRIFAIKIARAHSTISLTSAVTLGQILPLHLRAREAGELYEIKRGKPIAYLPGRPIEIELSPYMLPHPANRKPTSFGLITDQEEVIKLGSETHLLFTDGSKIDGKVGGTVTWCHHVSHQIKAFAISPED